MATIMDQATSLAWAITRVVKFGFWTRKTAQWRLNSLVPCVDGPISGATFETLEMLTLMAAISTNYIRAWPSCGMLACDGFTQRRFWFAFLAKEFVFEFL